MRFSLFSIFIAVIFLIRSSAVTFPFGALYLTWILQSKPNWNGNNQQCWKNSRPLDNKLESMKRQLEESSNTQMSELKKIRLTEPRIFKKKGHEQLYKSNEQVKSAVNEAKDAVVAVKMAWRLKSHFSAWEEIGSPS